MTKPLSSAALLAGVTGDDADLLKRFLMLVERININPNTGALHLQNGKASIALYEDGEIRLHGTRIVQMSERDITLDAAWIDLN
ncbi:MAG: hypothetical protein ACRBBK_05285 [Paracoccaceae bacterium]